MLNDLPAPPSSAYAGDATAVAARVAASLDQLATALARVDTHAVLDSEATLASLLSELERVRTASDRESTARAVREAKHALLRCRRLGISFGRVARAWHQADPYTGGYDRTGDMAGVRDRTSGMKATV